MRLVIGSLLYWVIRDAKRHKKHGSLVEYRPGTACARCRPPTGGYREGFRTYRDGALHCPSLSPCTITGRRKTDYCHTKFESRFYGKHYLLQEIYLVRDASAKECILSGRFVWFILRALPWASIDERYLIWYDVI